MEEKASVIATNGKFATVRVERRSACADCGKCMIGKNNMNVDAQVYNTIGASVGDSVTVQMDLGGILPASGIMYGIPLVAFIMGCAVGYFLLSSMLAINPDLCGFLTGIALTAIAYYFIKAADRKGKFKEKFRIKLVDFAKTSSEKEN